MTEKEMLTFLNIWQDKVVVNKFGCKATVDGISPNGMFVICTWVEDTQIDDKHPSRVGGTGMINPDSLGRLWKLAE